MYKLNRKSKYEIIKKLLFSCNNETIKKVTQELGLYDNNIASTKEELISYLEEMNKCWNDNNKNLTDRQHIKVLK